MIDYRMIVDGVDRLWKGDNQDQLILIGAERLMMIRGTFSGAHWNFAEDGHAFWRKVGDDGPVMGNNTTD